MIGAGPVAGDEAGGDDGVALADFALEAIEAPAGARQLDALDTITGAGEREFQRADPRIQGADALEQVLGFHDMAHR